MYMHTIWRKGCGQLANYLCVANGQEDLSQQNEGTGGQTIQLTLVRHPQSLMKMASKRQYTFDYYLYTVNSPPLGLVKVY